MTTKSVGRVNPTDHLAKNHFFSIKSGCFSPKIGKKKTKLSKSVSGYYKIKRKKEKKVEWTNKPLV